MDSTPPIHQLRMDSSDSSCSNRTRSIASLGGSEDSILEEREPPSRGGRIPRLSDGFSPDEQDSGFNSTSQLECSPHNGSLRCRTPEIKPHRHEDSDDVWLPRFPRAKKLGTDRTLGTSGSLGSTDSWIENSVSEEEEEMDDTDIARCLTSMSMGSGVIKVNGSGRCAVKTLYLEGNKSCIRWRPSKKGSKAKINIESIKEIREGLNTDTFKKYLASGNKCNPKNAFSIIHGTSWETLDLISDTEEEIVIWLRGLKHLMRGLRSEIRRLNNNKLRDCWLKATFEAADKSGDGLLSMDEVLKLLHKLNVNLSKRKVKQLFKEADSQDDNIGKLDFEEFIHFYRTISTRQEVDLLLHEYGNGKGYMTTEEFAKFLKEEQGLGDVELDMCQELVQTYEPIPDNAKNGWMGIDGFTSYLLSHEGDIFNPAHREVHQDMTRPLSHYYIASSHNTYLVGDQLMSQSSVDVYALVLQSGCRCVEMDCWDGKDGEPIIYHGYTLTSKIKFRDVISIISKYAFVTSPYPVILSIENHCSLEQQKKMALYLIEILGEMLHIPPINSSKISLPSPEELKGKILIKAKKLPSDHNENLEAGEVSEEDSADELDDDFKLETSSISKKFESVAMAQLMLMRKKPITPTRSAWQRIVSKVREDSKQKNSKNHARSSSLTGTLRRLKLAKKKPKSQSSSESSEGGSLDLLEKPMTDEESAGDQPTTASNPKTPSPQPIRRSHKGKSIVLSRQLSELVQLTRSVGFRGFKAAMLSWELPSLGEIRASNLVATKAPDFVQFTANHMCRVYPSAYRIDSSNYNPQPMWNCGCQLVALNYQTEGRPMQLSRARFSMNGNSGYALKHPLLCDESKPFDPNSGDPVSHLPKKQLTIHVISGQQLPKPPQSLLGERGEIIDPYVEVEVIGLPVDCAKAQTKTIQDNGFNPFWDCTMTFTLHLEEMALIRFAVWDEDPIGRDFIGQATFAVSSLMPGYRHIHLEGLDQATLFVHVTLEDYNTWLNSTARFRPRGSHCRTKSMELEYSPLSSSPTHRLSPRRKSSLGIVQKLNMRRRHSMAALPARELSPLPFGTRMKRRSYEDGNLTGSAGELRPTAEELSEYYLELTLTCTDTILDILLNSPVPTSLELNGSISISVDDLPEVFSFYIPPSALFRAIQEHKLSLRSEESYTAVESFATLTELWRSQRQQEYDYDSLSLDTDSMASSMNYDQFVHDVFEDCFSQELTYDPRPDLLKEASPSRGSSSSDIDKQGLPQDVSSDDVMSQDTVSSVGVSCESESHDTGTCQKEPSDQDSDDVFLPDVSKQVCPVDQLVVEECFQKVVKLPHLKIPNLSLVVPSPTVSPVPNSPSSPQVCTFTRDAVQRRSRIIYDDTAEFIIQPCSDSEIMYRSLSERTQTLSQKRLSSMSITGSFFQEFDNMLQKYQDESHDDTIENDPILGKTDVQGLPAPDKVLTTLDSTSDTSLNCPDVINNTPSTALGLSSPQASDNSDDDESESDMLSVSCDDDVISDIISADRVSNQSGKLLKTTSKGVSEALPNTEGGYPEITSLMNVCNFADDSQRLTRSQNITNHLDGVYPNTPRINEKLDEGLTEIAVQPNDLTMLNDRNNNRGISLQMLTLIHNEEPLKSHSEKNSPQGDVMTELKVEDSVRLMGEKDSVDVEEGVVCVDVKNGVDVGDGVDMDDSELVDGLVDIDEGVDVDDSVENSYTVDTNNGVNVVDEVDVNNEDISESVDTKYDVDIHKSVGMNGRVDVDNGVDVDENVGMDFVDRVDNDTWSDGDSDDTSSTASLSSVPSSVSSSDTVVEVPSFPKLPRDSSDNISPNLSPLRLEDIFNPNECKQFRSELVQRWQKNIPQEKSICKTRSPSAQLIPRINQGDSGKPPVVIPGKVINGPRPFSNKARPISVIGRDFTQRNSPALDKNNSHTNPKRLSWPPCRQKGHTLDKGRLDFKPNMQNGTCDSETDGRITSGRPDSAGKGLPSYPSCTSTRGSSSLHLPSYTDVVYKSQLSQIRLSRPGNGQQQPVRMTTTTSASAGTRTHVLPSYHDHANTVNRSQKPATPTGLGSPTGKGLLERKPPSYEDHISRYGIPFNQRPIPTARTCQPNSSFKLCHAEPVQVSKVESAKRSSGLLDGDSETVSALETESEVSAIEDNRTHSKPGVQKYNCCTWPYKSAASSKTIQLHPTPPRRRKKLPDRYLENEESPPTNPGSLRGSKGWSAKPEKGHNVYLMLTL